jgi:hypothetical protein
MKKFAPLGHTKTGGFTMKKVISLVVAALALSASLALAAPATPVFNAPVKIAEGKIRTSSDRVAFDGTSIYAAYGSLTALDGSSEASRIVSSTNSGAIWGLSYILQASDPANNIWTDDLSVRVAVSNDPLFSGKKIVHAIWHAYNGVDGTDNIYYAYKANRPTLTGWSTPVAILTNTPTTSIDGMGTSLMVTTNGAVHVVSGNLYATASSPDSAFTTSEFVTNGWTPQAVIDSTGNLYVVSYDGSSVFLTKKASGSSTWSTPTTVFTTATGGISYVSIAVADTNTYYVAYNDGAAMCLSVSTNAGRTWTKRTVIANQASNNFNPAIAVTSTKIITYVTEVFDATGANPVIKVLRSSDNGATWSAAATIKGQATPSIALDSTNKAHILVRDEVGGWTGNANLLWIKEK